MNEYRTEPFHWVYKLFKQTNKKKLRAYNLKESIVRPKQKQKNLNSSKQLSLTHFGHSWKKPTKNVVRRGKDSFLRAMRQSDLAVLVLVSTNISKGSLKARGKLKGRQQKPFLNTHEFEFLRFLTLPDKRILGFSITKWSNSTIVVIKLLWVTYTYVLM